MSDRIRLTGREGPIELIRAANTLDLFDVLADLFDLRLPRDGRSGKSLCPFGFEHPDGGIEKAFRTYPDGNHGYCFGEHGYLDPVRLVQLRDDVSATVAARILLRRYNALAPMPYWQRFAEVERDRHVKRNEIGETSYAVEALNVALRAHPRYAEGQYHPSYIAALERALDVLNALSAAIPDNAEEKLDEWFTRARALLERTLDALPATESHATLVSIPADDEGDQR